MLAPTIAFISSSVKHNVDNRVVYAECFIGWLFSACVANPSYNVSDFRRRLHSLLQKGDVKDFA